MRKQIRKTVVLLLISIFITGCSGISNLEKGFGETKQTEYKLQDDNVFSLGEEIGLIEPTEEDKVQFMIWCQGMNCDDEKDKDKDKGKSRCGSQGILR